jgi:hypothetical protein
MEFMNSWLFTQRSFCIVKFLNCGTEVPTPNVRIFGTEVPTPNMGTEVLTHEFGDGTLVPQKSRES